LYLGIDTSAYTTSVAVVDSAGRLLSDKRLVLPVPEGDQGLKQSTALFYHMQNLPNLVREVAAQVDLRQLRALAASGKPRPSENSYMPVFLAGLQLAESIAAVMKIPLIKTTHQEGHLAAGLWSAGCLELARFLAVHFSGGTSEILLVEREPGHELQYRIEILGGSEDLAAGQFIDRVGVAMGLPLTAGPGLERLAREQEEENGEIRGAGRVVLKSSVRGLRMSFSGAETAAKRLLAQNTPRAEVARAVEHCLATTLEKVLRRAALDTGIKDILVVGGVAANSYLRRRLKHRLEHPAIGAHLIYPHTAYSSDNAVGASIIARSKSIL